MNKILLKDLLGEIDPERLEKMNAREIARFHQRIDEIKQYHDSMFVKINKALQDGLAKHRTTMEGYMKNVDSLLTEYQNTYKSTSDSVDKKHMLFYEMIQKEIADHKKNVDKLIEDTNDGIRKSYSKMGGGTMPMMRQLITATTTGSGIYTISPSVILNELDIYVGGALTFYKNGDWTYTLSAGNYVNSFTLSAQLQASIIEGSSINVWGRI